MSSDSGEKTESTDGSTCLELALEGERLCKAGDCRAGVAFFEAAIQAGTDDLRTLSAIYSQLGNAYFYLGDYVKAMQYHKHDLTLARTMGDKMGEAKASGNLGNTLKVMGKFDEAMICCKRHLEISRELDDKVGEGRALYNLGNVYHAKGKHIGRLGQQDPGEFPEEVRACLQQAVHYYEENLKLVRELNDTGAQGRACGNLGNTHYLLGNFAQSISYHEERLKIAREFGDKAAERRAHSNLGNAHIFLGEFETAAEHYKRTLVLAQELGDRAVEAQACYSLGNTYTLLRDYPSAISYHLRHLRIAQELMDRVGESRACWSLGNAHSAMGNHEKALYFATKHLEISREIGDAMGQATAQMNVSDLRRTLGLPEDGPPPEAPHGLDLGESSADRVRRLSMESMDLIKMTPEGKAQRIMKTNLGNRSPLAGGASPLHGAGAADVSIGSGSEHFDDEDSFFELLSRFQSKRMDDQRCSLTVMENKENHVEETVAPRRNNNNNNNNNPNTNNGETLNAAQDDLLDLIAGMQSKRMDEQRVALPHLPGLHPPHNHPPGVIHHLTAAAASVAETAMPDDGFFDMLMRCQGTRLEDQRSTLPENESPTSTPQKMPGPVRGLTVPDEDFFSLILRLQAGRMEDQRAPGPGRVVPSSSTSNNSHLPHGNHKGSKKEKKK